MATQKTPFSILIIALINSEKYGVVQFLVFIWINPNLNAIYTYMVKSLPIMCVILYKKFKETLNALNLTFETIKFVSHKQWYHN